VTVDDLDIPVGNLAPGAKRVVDRAIEEARRREHALITSAHLLCAFAQTEWDLFAHSLRDAGINPHNVLAAIDGHLRRVTLSNGGRMRVRPTTALACSAALALAADLLIGLFAETNGAVAASLRQHGGDAAARLGINCRTLQFRMKKLGIMRPPVPVEASV
jgi:ATP-dependent Clp protease ATP-binding subunit ClpA